MNFSDNSTQTQYMNVLYHLPSDIIEEMLTFCSWEDKTLLRSTCRNAYKWTTKIQHGRTWRNTLLEDAKKKYQGIWGKAYLIDCDNCNYIHKAYYKCVECASRYGYDCMPFSQCNTCGYLMCEYCKQHDCSKIEILAVYRV